MSNWLTCDYLPAVIKDNGKSARNIVAKAAIFLAVAVVFYGIGLLVLDEIDRQYSRTTKERQFTVGGEWHDNDLTVIREFEKRHKLDPEAKRGLRLAMSEWPRWRYQISLENLGDGSAKGAIYAIVYDGTGPAYERSFSLNKADAKLFFDVFDKKVKGYRGEAFQCLDGTGLRFERWQQRAVVGASGNAACMSHYADLMSLLAETLSGSLSDAPFDWRTWFAAKRVLELGD